MKSDIYRQVEAALSENCKSDELHFVVAVSGGVDSMVLLALLKQLAKHRPIRLTAVHLDHMYRADAAIDDARLVRRFCRQLGVAHYVYRRPIKRLAAAAGKGFEEVARTTRYHLFRALKVALRADYIVTAHHQDDLAESVLMHLLRGTGLSGLVGIRPLDGDLWRPLLNVRKSAILDYAKAQAIPYNNDVSNDDTLFLRNKIRHQLMPNLTSDYNAALVENLAQLSDIALQESDYLAADTAAFYRQVVAANDELALDRKRYCRAPIARRRRLIRLLYHELIGSAQNLSYQHVNLLDNWLMSGAINTRQSLRGLNFFIDRAAVRLSLGDSKTAVYEATILQRGVNLVAQFGLTITLSDEPLSGHGACDTLYLPAKCAGGELVVRTRRAGDFMRLKGFKKSLKKLFNEQQIAIAERAKLPLLCSGDEVLWGKGLRPSIYQAAASAVGQVGCYAYIEVAN